MSNTSAKMGEIAHPFCDNACHALDDHGRIFLGPEFFPVVPERCKKPLILAKCRNYRLLFLSTLTKNDVQVECKMGEIAHSFRDNACHALDDHGRIFLGPDFFPVVPERCKKPLILAKCRNYRLLFLSTLTDPDVESG